MPDPCFTGISRSSLRMAEDYPFRPCGIHHNSKRMGSRQSLAIVPWHPFRGAGGQFPGVALQLDQIVEGVGATQLAGVDQAHEQIADLCPVQSAIKQGVLASMEIFPYSELCSVPDYRYEQRRRGA